MKNRVLIIGESCLDVFIYGRCDRLCPDAPVPVFNPVEKNENDGMAMNVAKNISSLGVDYDIITNEGWKQSKKNRYIDSRTNQMFLRIDDNDTVDKEFDLKSFKEKDLEKYGAIIISDYCKGFLPEDTIYQISLSHPLVFLDTKKLLGDWCSEINFIKINSYEYDKTKHLVNQEMGEKLVITLGSHGTKFRGVEYPVEHVEIKDSSGAGDTYIAALVAKYIETNSIEGSISFANECATRVVQRRGVSII